MEEPRDKRTAQAELVRHGGILSLLTLASRVLGLLREMVKASLLGTSALSDAFSVAFMIPNLFRRLFAEGSVAVAFIPTFKEYLLENRGQGGPAEQRAAERETAENPGKIADFISCFFTFLTFIVSLAVALGILISPLIVPLFGMEEPEETVLLTRLMFPFLGFISLAALFQGILNSLRIFTPSGLAPILLNILTILCAYGLSPFMKNPARAMAAGILAGGFLEAAIQLPFVLRKAREFRWKGAFVFTGLRRAAGNPGTRKVLKLIGPTVIGMAAYQLNDLVSTALAGRAGAGIVSSLQYSLRLQELILGVFAVSIGTVLLPDLAEQAKSGRWDTYNDRLVSAMNIIALITVPVTFFSLAGGEHLIRLLFRSRSFDETSVALTLEAFRFHMPGLFFIALNRILAPAFYAQSDSRSPTLAGIISFGVNMALAALLVRPFRGSGIALALTLASGVNTALLLGFLKRNPLVAVGRALRSALVYTLKLALVSAAALIPAAFLLPRFTELFRGHGRILGQGLPLVLAGLIFALLGTLILYLSGDKQIRGLSRLLGSRIAGSRGK
jgi:putative peptidoglycan lipid II flippase